MFTEKINLKITLTRRTARAEPFKLNDFDENALRVKPCNEFQLTKNLTEKRERGDDFYEVSENITKLLLSANKVSSSMPASTTRNF